jgi:hypothetical protein
MTTDAGTVATFGLLLPRMTVTAAAGAEDSVTVRVSDWPSVKAGFADRTMAPADVSVTVATPLVILGRLGAEAVMVAVPAPIPVTGTDAVVAPEVIVTDCGTPTMPDGLALRLTVTPPVGAGADNVSVRFVVPVPVMVVVAGLKLRAAVTEITWLPDP